MQNYIIICEHGGQESDVDENFVHVILKRNEIFGISTNKLDFYILKVFESST